MGPGDELKREDVGRTRWNIKEDREGRRMKTNREHREIDEERATWKRRE